MNPDCPTHSIQYSSKGPAEVPRDHTHSGVRQDTQNHTYQQVQQDHTYHLVPQDYTYPQVPLNHAHQQVPQDHTHQQVPQDHTHQQVLQDYTSIQVSQHSSTPTNAKPHVHTEEKKAPPPKSREEQLESPAEMRGERDAEVLEGAPYHLLGGNGVTHLVPAPAQSTVNGYSKLHHK
jgi:hypothetical protein